MNALNNDPHGPTFDHLPERPGKARSASLCGGSWADALPKKAWQRRSAGAGSKGPRHYDWALHRLYLDDTGWGHWLLVRRQIKPPHKRAYYRVFAPADTTLEQMVAVAKARAAAEEELQTINVLPAALLRRAFSGEM